jgi:hypothetical protein
LVSVHFHRSYGNRFDKRQILRLHRTSCKLAQHFHFLYASFIVSFSNYLHMKTLNHALNIPCYSNEKVVVEKKVVRSLRRCAPLRPIAELKFLLRLILNVGKILCSTSRRFSSRPVWSSQKTRRVTFVNL